MGLNLPGVWVDYVEVCTHPYWFVCRRKGNMDELCWGIELSIMNIYTKGQVSI